MPKLFLRTRRLKKCGKVIEKCRAQSHAAMLCSQQLTSCCFCCCELYFYWSKSNSLLVYLSTQRCKRLWWMDQSNSLPLAPFNFKDFKLEILSLPQLCSVLYWRRPESERCYSSLPCWPASVWGTTPRPSDPASESPETSGSSAPGPQHTNTHTRQVSWTQMNRLSCVRKPQQHTKQTHIYQRLRQRVVGMPLHFTNVLPTLTEPTGLGAQTPPC